MTEYLIQVQKELIKIHRDIIMKAEILFVNKIPFFLNVSRKIALPWYTILCTGKLRQYTLTSMLCTSNIEIGDL